MWNLPIMVWQYMISKNIPKIVKLSPSFETRNAKSFVQGVKQNLRIIENPLKDEIFAVSVSGQEILNNTSNTLIIIPAYNEENNLGSVLDAIKKWTPNIPVLVVDDGSTDSTAMVAENHGAELISLPFNSGYGVALQTGFIYAVRNQYSMVVQLDADGQHDPQFIPELLQEVQKGDLDVVVGSRFLGKGTYKASFPRQIGMFIFAHLASLFCGQKVTDPTSGFQVLRGSVIRFGASKYFPPDYPDADFLIMLHRSGFKVKEIPVTMRPSPLNKSMHQGHKTIYYVFKMFLSIIVTLLRQKPKRN